MDAAKLTPLEQLVKLEADQLRQSLTFISQIQGVIAKQRPVDDLADFELKWLGIKEDK